MCGIAGIYDLSKRKSQSELNLSLERMVSALEHRGPDDRGTWAEEKTGIALGHRRLSIIDLSEYGHQPMASQSGSCIMVFNGEVYNFQEIGSELKETGHSFRGHSDTEVVLAAIEEYGIFEAASRFIGMFAFAVWDRRNESLYLVRDRIGIKPVYYGWVDNMFLFGSELKALCAALESKPEIDSNSLALYLRYNNVPAPYSIYKNIYKLPPGTILKLDFNKPRENVVPVPYWSAKTVVENALQNPFTGSESEAINALEGLLQDAVRLRMISDVPLGAFMSGGIDSSLVVSLMQSQSSKPVNTFTIGFSESGFDEAKKAKLVARHLGTKHTELYVTAKNTLDVIPALSVLYDEPFADSSQIPTYIISKLTKKHVKVALSGDGGDELFAGYNRYLWFKDRWNKISWLPQRFRNLASRIILAVSSEQAMNFFGKNIASSDKLQKLAGVLKLNSPQDIYLWLVSHCKEPLNVVLNAVEPPTALNDPYPPETRDFIQKMMYFDLITYLPDDILVKVDRASMGVSLEARVPLLDHRVVEFAWRLPLAMKIHNGQSKWLLRQILYKYVPGDLVNGPKMGFSVPVDIWLKSHLRDWAESLLDYQGLKKDGLLNAEVIRDNWHEHLSGRRNWKDFLWPVLMFQAWRRHWL